MDNEKVFAFHEKLYYHELDSREKLTARLQLFLGILTVLIGVMAYMVAHFSITPPVNLVGFGFFVVAFVVGAALLLMASFEFVRALWSHSYNCLPFATQIESYRTELKGIYEAYPGGGELAASYYEAFILEYLTRCTTTNASVNARRYKRLHFATSYVVYSIPAVVAAGLAFTIGGFAFSLAS